MCVYFIRFYRRFSSLPREKEPVSNLDPSFTLFLGISTTPTEYFCICADLCFVLGCISTINMMTTPCQMNNLVIAVCVVVTISLMKNDYFGEISNRYFLSPPTLLFPVSPVLAPSTFYFLIQHYVWKINIGTVSILKLERYWMFSMVPAQIRGAAPLLFFIFFLGAVLMKFGLMLTLLPSNEIEKKK